MKTVNVMIKSVYGNDLIYPVCANSRIFAELTGKKTLSREDLNKISRLGFRIAYQPYGEPKAV